MGHEDLGAVDEDVPFDHAGADTLMTAFTTMADAIEGQIAQRDAAAADAKVDWRGLAVGMFDQRVAAGNADARELVTALRDAREDVAAMKRAAEEEQDRREAARRYIQALRENEENESLWNQFTDWVGTEDFEPPPMPPPPRPEPNLTAPPGAADPRV